jgi:acyl carrier protein
MEPGDRAVDRAKLLDKFAEIVCDVGQIPVSSVTGEARLVEDLDLDSLSLVEIAEIARSTWNVSLRDTDIRRFTVNDVVASVERQLASAPADLT